MKKVAWLVVGILTGVAIAVTVKEMRDRHEDEDAENLSDSIDQSLEELERRAEFSA